MKKIMFFISRCDEKSGLLRHVVNMANGFANCGMEVEILTFKGVRDEVWFPLHKNVTVTSIYGRAKEPESQEKASGTSAESVSVEERSSRKSYKSARKKILYRIKNQISAVPLFSHQSIKKNYAPYFCDFAPDVVIVWGLRRMARAWYATRGMHCKIFDAEFNSFESTFPRDDIENNRILKKCNGVIVQTNREKELLTPFCKRVFVINNPIKDNLPSPYQGIRSKRIVNFCRISPQKNLELLIDSFKKIHCDFPEYELHIYGDTSVNLISDTEYKKSLLHRIHEKELDDATFIHRSREDIHSVILDSSMFVSSSDYEGLSNSMLEAMAIGLPCVCTDCRGGGVREVMTDHENGLIVPMNDVEALYKAMKEYIVNPELAIKCGNNAVKIRETLSTDKIVKQWVEVLNQY